MPHLLLLPTLVPAPRAIATIMNTSALLCAPSADAAFGPAVARECRDGFDFTLAFEQSIFVILPASLLLAAAPLRLFQLTRARVKLAHDRFRYVKLVRPAASLSVSLSPCPPLLSPLRRSRECW